MKEEIKQLKQKAIEERWTSFLEWINNLSPWNFWVDYNDKSKGLKPHIIDKLSELEQAVKKEVIESLIELLRGVKWSIKEEWISTGLDFLDERVSNYKDHNEEIDDLIYRLQSQLKELN
jgi:hypothetical protein